MPFSKQCLEIWLYGHLEKEIWFYANLVKNSTETSAWKLIALLSAS